jgi:hypothetical protein
MPCILGFEGSAMTAPAEKEWPVCQSAAVIGEASVNPELKAEENLQL